MKNLTVVKSNRVIEASYKLTLIEQKTLLAGISQIDSRKPLDPLQGFEISVDDLIQLSETETKNEYRDLKIAAERLLTRIVTINNPLPNEKRVTQLKTHWVSSVFYIPEEGKIRLYFSPQIVPYLSQLTSEFTQYQLKCIGKMSSIYAIRLYELLMQWKDVGKRDVELEWLKQCFELGDKYPSIKDFKKYVLDPAVKDINEHSSLQVAWTQRKSGRTVTHLLFTFAEKKPLIPEKPKRVTKPKEKMYFGVPKSEIEKVARIGESYEDVAARINKAKESAKINNIDHFADLRKRLGDKAITSIPEDIANILKAQGRW
jgi:plasmid replication initiation protein